MIKNKNELFCEIKSIQDIGNNVYVGKIEEIKGDVFDTSNLFVASLFNYSINLNSYKTDWNETALKYVFERINTGNRIFYRELFSGAKMEIFDFSSLMKLKGIYLSDPISYDEYIEIIYDKTKSKKIKILS